MISPGDKFDFGVDGDVWLVRFFVSGLDVPVLFLFVSVETVLSSSALWLFSSLFIVKDFFSEFSSSLTSSSLSS